MNLLGDYLKKIESQEFLEIEKFGSLFYPDWNNLKKCLCPVCSRKLYPMRDKNLFYCRNKGHKRFVIHSHKVLKYKKKEV